MRRLVHDVPPSFVAFDIYAYFLTSNGYVGILSLFLIILPEDKEELCVYTSHMIDESAACIISNRVFKASFKPTPFPSSLL